MFYLVNIAIKKLSLTKKKCRILFLRLKRIASCYFLKRWGIRVSHELLPLYHLSISPKLTYRCQIGGCKSLDDKKSKIERRLRSIHLTLLQLDKINNLCKNCPNYIEEKDLVLSVLKKRSMKQAI